MKLPFSFWKKEVELKSNISVWRQKYYKKLSHRKSESKMQYHEINMFFATKDCGFVYRLKDLTWHQLNQLYLWTARNHLLRSKS